MTYALQIDALTKRYGSFAAVDGLSLRIPTGELACLIGPNGAGKSTLMRTVAGLQIPDTGQIRIAGEDVSHAPHRAKTLSAITPQDLSLFEYLTGEETLRMVADLRGISSERESRITRWLALTELDRDRGRLVCEYSGGMKRKLAVAAALLSEPPLVLLDESFTGMDPESTHAIQGELRAYCDRGGSVLLSSHILDMVATIADRVLVMAGGSCVEDLDRTGLSEAVPARFPSLTELYLERVGKRAPGGDDAGAAATERA